MTQKQKWAALLVLAICVGYVMDVATSFSSETVRNAVRAGVIAFFTATLMYLLQLPKTEEKR